MKNSLLINGKNLFNKYGRRILLKGKVKSPQILAAVGISLAAVSIYSSIKATIKAEPIIKDTKNKIVKIHENMENENLIKNGEYSIEEGKKELKKEYITAGKKLIKTYSPCILMFLCSTACTLKSFNILKTRELGAAAAYATVSNAYDEYRKRVKNKFGEEIEKEIYQDYHEVETEETIIDSKGKEKTVIKKKKVMGNTPIGDYTYLFDETNSNFDCNVRSNLNYLKYIQAICNNRLINKGYLFLSEVYSALGVDINTLTENEILRSKVVGWIYDTTDKSNRDCYVDFGIFTDNQGNANEYSMEQIRSGEPRIWLNFNVDGDILTGRNGLKTFAKYAKSLSE